MAIRVPRGYAKNRPQYIEVCEGVRPTDTAAAREAYTGLPHVRVDELAHDPIVLDPGTIVGYVSYTGAATTLLGKVVPCIIPTGTGANENAHTLRTYGSAEASTWTLPLGTSGDISNVGLVKPIGVVFQPIYSFNLQQVFTNYKRQESVGVVTDYVIMVPATNDEEVSIRSGDRVIVGSGEHYGIGWSTPYNTHRQAGRYARYNSLWSNSEERVVGRCLKKIRIATTASSEGTKLSADLANITLTAEARKEFGYLDKVQTVPGSGLSGSETKGIPAYLLDARADGGDNHSDGSTSYWALVMLIRL